MGQLETTGRRITAEEATIKAAAVEIKILTINGKQMTLAVFRQLKKATLHELDEQIERLEADIWGVVNYHTKDCDWVKQLNWSDSHLHVVWQLGNELLTTLVQKSRVSPELWDCFADLDQLFIAV